jgi:uncharacterized protein (TIGR03437 family)
VDLLQRLVLVGLCLTCAFGQTYTMGTFLEGTSGTSLGLSQSFAVDPNGNIFIPLVRDNLVVRFDSVTRTLTVVAGTGKPGFSGDNGPATSAQLNVPWATALDSDGNLYIADALNSRVRKVSNGVITTVAGGGASLGDNGPATSGQVPSPNGVALDSAGNLYISEYGNLIRKVSKGVITTVAGTGEAGFSGDDGPATRAQIYGQRGIAVDAAGNLYIADTGNNRIRKVTGGVITTVAGNGAPGFGGDNGPATNAKLYNPFGVALGPDGSLYIADLNNSRVRKVSDGTITTVAGNGSNTSSGDNGPAVKAGVFPVAVAFDSAGTLYIDETLQIRKVSGGTISPVAGSIQTLFSLPYGLAVDAADNLYIADTSNNRIRRVSKGSITTVAGDDQNTSTASDRVYQPYALAVDKAGNTWFADTDPGSERQSPSVSRIRRASDGVVTTSTQLPGTTAVAADRAGNLYFIDKPNASILKLSNGTITTVTSNIGRDTSVATVSLNQPASIALDAGGSLYVADSQNHRILKIAGTSVTTIAGTGVRGFGGDDGPAASAQLCLPTALAVDSGGVLYFVDTCNARIRRVSGGIITTIAGNGATGAYANDGDLATNGQLGSVFALAVDSTGKVYFAGSTYGSSIKVLTPLVCNYSVTPGSIQAPGAGGTVSIGIQTAALCSWTVSGLPNWISLSTATGSGPATIALAVASNSGAPRTATVSIAGTSVQITQPNLPSISAGGIVNTASSAGDAFAPGSIATAYGNFAGVQTVSAGSSPLPTSLGGLFLQFFDGTKAPLFFASESQLNFQVPWNRFSGTSMGTSIVSVTVNDQTGPSMSMNISPYAPGIFSMNAQGTGQGAILDASYRLVDSSHPVRAGVDTVQIYCTGLGAVTNQPLTGTAAVSKPLSLTSTLPTVTIGGAPATVLFSGLAPGTVGEYQVNVLVPAASAKGAAVPVVLEIGGARSNSVTIAVQ